MLQSLLAPSILVLLALALLVTWRVGTRRRWLVWLASAQANCAAALILKITDFPASEWIRLFVSATLFLIAAFCFTESLCLRAKRPFGRIFGSAFVVLSLSVYCFWLYSGQLMARIITLNAAVSLLLILGVWRTSKEVHHFQFHSSVKWLAIAFAGLFVIRFSLTISSSDVTSYQASYWQWFQFSIVLFAIVLTFEAVVSTFLRRMATLEFTRDFDHLTRIRNRQGVLRSAAKLLKRIKREEVQLLLIDLDNFKKLNDTFGHPAGDAVLRKVGRILREQTRPGDIVGRLGGDEFVVLLPRTSASDAVVVADRIRALVSNLFSEGNNGRVCVSCSIGIATGTGELGYQSLYEKADRLLYAAKDTGRNRVLTTHAGQI